MSAAGVHRIEVDRFEGDLVVVRVDGGRVLDLPRWLLPDALAEGDVVTVRGEGEGTVVRLELRVDRGAGDAARAEAAALLRRLRGAERGGDPAP